MNTVILKIGSVDMTEDVLCEGVTIGTEAVYTNAFTAVTGKEKKTRLGDRISISASFSVLDESKAKAIVNACNSDSVTVSYADPFPSSAVFDRPSVTSVPSFEDGEVSYWNISLSMTCPLKGNGL